MQIKNKIIVIIICFLSPMFYKINVKADEFNISAEEIVVDKENDIVVGKGSVEVVDKEGTLIKSEKVTYEKSKEFLLAEGEVEFIDK